MITSALDVQDLLPTSEFVTVDDLPVHYAVSGSGVPLVMLHGSGSSLHIFDDVARQLAPGFRIVRPDLPGFGLTGPHPAGDYTVRRYVEFVRHFTDAVVGEPFVLAGHSFGGQVAWNFALDHVDQIDSLVLMNSTGYPEKDIPTPLRLARNPIARPLMRRVGSQRLTTGLVRGMVGPGYGDVADELAHRVARLSARPGNRSALVDFANTDQPDRSGEIPQITVPTLVLRSDLVEGQRFAADIAGSQEVSLGGVGHMMPAEAPTAVATAIGAFVADKPIGGR